MTASRPLLTRAEELSGMILAGMITQRVAGRRLRRYLEFHLALVEGTTDPTVRSRRAGEWLALAADADVLLQASVIAGLRRRAQAVA